MWNAIVRSGCELGPVVDELISLLSPLNLSLDSGLELVDALGEVSDSLFNIFWDGLIILKERSHGDHVGDGSDGGLFGVCDFFGVLFGNLLLSIGIFVLACGVKIDVSFHFGNFSYNIIFG